jgi:hypothetical protein
LVTVRAEVARLDAALQRLRGEIPQTPVMRRLAEDQQRTSHMLIKGNFLAPGPEVEANVPAAFHSLPEGAPRNRLGLAKWLIAPDNPLTARVAVNRYWARIFGRGIVETEEDFGTQGTPPTHPELLDLLAMDFVDSGWDVKGLLRRIVCSATYRQSSRATEELLTRDPQNRLLARGPSRRLEAEAVRDTALSVAGLLSHTLGGPSVYPPQPEGLWRPAFNGQRTWPTSTGADRYRRGLYTYWRRTIPYPSMAAFDAPSREICTIRRTMTNTPLQAFVTLNDPVYVEAAQSLARRIVREVDGDPRERAAWALRETTARPADDMQVDAVVQLFETELAHYQGDMAAAEKLATQPLGPLPEGLQADELAAWTVVANVLLNLDAVLTSR